MTESIFFLVHSRVRSKLASPFVPNLGDGEHALRHPPTDTAVGIDLGGAEQVAAVQQTRGFSRSPGLLGQRRGGAAGGGDTLVKHAESPPPHHQHPPVIRADS